MAFLVPLIIQCALPMIKEPLCNSSPLFVISLAAIPFSPICWIVLCMTYITMRVLKIKITYGKDAKGQPKTSYLLPAYILYYVIMLLFYLSLKSVVCSIL